MKAEKGLASHGIPAGGLDLRPPAKLEQPCILIDMLRLTAIGFAGLLYGLGIAIYNLVNRLFFQKPISIAGKICFVTGSARGLGRDICLELARNGAILACADINEANNKETVKLIHDLGGQARAYKLNVVNKQEVEETAKRVEEELGPVYLVVNNAALVMPDPQVSEEFVRASYNINVMGYLWVAQAFLPFLKKRNAGHIIVIGSLSSILCIPFLDIYSSTKAAVRSLARTMDLQLRMENSKVKVTAIHPTVMNSTADYTEFFKIRLNIVSTFDVVAALMNVVKYGGQEITVPFYTKLSVILLQIMPMEVVYFVLKHSGLDSDNHSVEKYNESPWGKIVRESGDQKNVQ